MLTDPPDTLTDPPTASAPKAAHSPPATDGPTQRRVGFLDIARGWAMIGVVVMNAEMFAVSTEMAGNTERGPVTNIINGAASLVFSNHSRELLMLLLGLGAVLTWRSAVRRGARPGWLLVRRYTLLFAVFGLAHRYVFDGDILTHYALAAVVVVALLPLLLTGARWRPLALAAALIPLSAAVQVVIPAELPFDAQYLLSTLAAFAIGVWLARLPGVAGDTDASGEADDGTTGARRATPRLVIWGPVLTTVGVLVAGGTSLAFPQRFDAEGVPLPKPATAEALNTFGGDVLIIGVALFYFAVIWWLVDRGGAVARAMSVLAPLGRMSLTVYLGSTAVFLLTMNGRDEGVTELTQLGIAGGFALAMILVCPLWLRAFRYGPAEWLWRCLTYLRPLAIRRQPGTDAR